MDILQPRSPSRTPGDLLLLSLDDGFDIMVAALDIVGTFDWVWNAELLEKQRAKGIQ